MKKHWGKYLALFLVASFLGAALLHTSQSVQHAEDELHALQVQVQNEREAIRVLQAEWGYLNRPDRLEGLATQYLDLRPPSADQMFGNAASLPSRSTLEFQTDDNDEASKDVKFSAPQSLAVKALSVSIVPKPPRVKPARRMPVPADNDFGDLLKRLDKEAAQ